VNLKNKFPFHYPHLSFHSTLPFLFSLFPFFTAIIFIPLYILLLNSCTTEPQTGSLTGTVNLEGETDHSGITLGIYELVTLDTTITRINNEYPHIGIKISQYTEFDHRFGNLTKYTQTDANGSASWRKRYPNHFITMRFFI